MILSTIPACGDQGHQCFSLAGMQVHLQCRSIQGAALDLQHAECMPVNFDAVWEVTNISQLNLLHL